jgi:hypothetical protein
MRSNYLVIAPIIGFIVGTALFVSMIPELVLFGIIIYVVTYFLCFEIQNYWKREERNSTTGQKARMEKE